MKNIFLKFCSNKSFIYAMTAAALCVSIFIVASNYFDNFQRPLKPKADIVSERSLIVEEIVGTSEISNAENISTNAYEGMHLYSGDNISVKDDASMTILVDMDRYLYVEENTKLRIEASESSGNKKTVVYVDEGAVTTSIQTPLSDNESFQISTSNSVMAVRGTSFKVNVSNESAKRTVTQLSVYRGEVNVILNSPKDKDNNISLYEGDKATITQEDNISEYSVESNQQKAE